MPKDNDFIPFIINSWRGGLSESENKGIKGSFKRGENLNIHSRQDVLTCNQRMKRELYANDLILSFVNASDGSLLGFGDAGYIYKRTVAGLWTTPTTEADGRICGAYEWKESNGSDYIYWTDRTHLNRKPFPGSSDWSDKEDNIQTLLNYDWHPMRQAAGVMVIGNDYYLGYVNWTGIFDSDAMRVVPGHRIKCLEELDDYVILGTERWDDREEGGIFSWLTSADNWIQKKAIPLKGVNALIATELLLLQAGQDGGLYYTDMVNRGPLVDCPYADEVYPGGVVSTGARAMFGFFTSPYTTGEYPGIYSYGRTKKNLPLALNLDYLLSIGTPDTIGALAMVDGSILASWRKGTDYGVDVVDASYKANGVFESLEFDGGHPDLIKRIEYIKVTMDGLASSNAIEVKYKMDKASSWTSAKLADGSTSFTTANATEAIFSVEDEGKIFEVQVLLFVGGNTAPVVHSVVSYLNPYFRSL